MPLPFSIRLLPSLTCKAGLTGIRELYLGAALQRKDTKGSTMKGMDSEIKKSARPRTGLHNRRLQE